MRLFFPLLFVLTPNLAGATTQLFIPGGASTCVVRGGDVNCWGGFGGIRQFFAQNRVTGVSFVSNVANSYPQACLIQAGRVRCTPALRGLDDDSWPWGRADDLAATPPDLDDAVSVRVGKAIYHGGSGRACAVRASGKVACWGDGVNPRSDLSDVQEILLMDPLFCYRDTRGETKCPGATDNNTLSFPLSELREPVLKIAHSEYRGYWGAVLHQDGQFHTFFDSRPVSILPAGIGPIKDFVAKGFDGNYCVVTAANDVYCSQRVDSSNLRGPMLRMPELSGGNITSLAASSSHTCVVSDEKVKCIGSNWHGQSEDRSSSSWHPIEVNVTEGYPFHFSIEGPEVPHLRCEGDWRESLNSWYGYDLRCETPDGSQYRGTATIHSRRRQDFDNLLREDSIYLESATPQGKRIVHIERPLEELPWLADWGSEPLERGR